MSFGKVLVANRGEIAWRVMRTAKAMGYRTVAVYSDADKDAPHVAFADEAVRIGPSPVGESYLSIDRILEAAHKSGADAVHPGYGFLSENEAFAAACEKAGLVFIGPPPAAIAAMGNKAAAKRRMIDAGVPCVPGYQGADQSDANLEKEARKIGLPVMVKAAAGGGGRGMRLVEREADLLEAIRTARTEAESAFGSGELILEKAVVDARHVEIQVFADAHGNVIHLGERDCSVQRRHQKVIEEAPSPAVNADLRRRMGAAAVAAARAIGYRGAGTVEFLLGADGAFYFLEMNTRLQVEHPVTEAITGQDLVAWQLKVAMGEKLPLTQEQVTFSGHAIEVRLYAEDAYAGFLPQTGRIDVWRPATGPGVRIDHGMKDGLAISPFYDPMIAKVIAHGATREEARTRLVRALRETVVLGPDHQPAFPDPPAGASRVRRRQGDHRVPRQARIPRARHRRRALAARGRAAVAAVGIALSGDAARLAQFQSRADAHPPRRRQQRTPAARRRRPTASTSTCRSTSTATTSSSTSMRSPCASPTRPTPRPPRRQPAATASCARRWTAASSPSRWRRATASAKGQTLIVLEAMKIQHQLKAALDAKVESVAVKEGQQVSNRAILVTMDLMFGGRCRCTLKRSATATAPSRRCRSIELDIADGETVALIGPSGCGKSTLLGIVGGLLEPTAGRVTFSGPPPAELAQSLHLHLPGFRPAALAQRRRQCRPGAGASCAQRRRAPRARRLGARLDRPRRVRDGLSQAALGRHAPARRHRPRAGRAAGGAAARRAACPPSTHRRASC